MSLQEFISMQHKSVARIANNCKQMKQRALLSDSFNGGAQTLDEATVSAQDIAESMERQLILLRAPSR